jgi:hypothetical protein
VTTDHEEHVSDAHAAAVEHGHDAGDDGHDADHDTEELGPIDWGAWGVSVLGVVLGSVVALVMYLSISS